MGWRWVDKAIRVNWVAVWILLVVVGLFAGRAEARRVELTVADGYRLVGTLSLPAEVPPVGGVVLLPMYRHTRESWQPLVDVLVRGGVACLAIDLRGHGDSRFGPDGSDGGRLVLARDSGIFSAMHMDAEAAVRYLTGTLGLAPQSVALVGASVGCSVAIHTVVAGQVKVGAVVVMTPGRDYLGIPTMAQIEHWPGIPMLILSSREEEKRGAGPIFRRLVGNGAELKIVPGSGVHGTNMFGEVDGVEGGNLLLVDQEVGAPEGKATTRDRGST